LGHSTCKLLGGADENSASDIASLLNTIEHLAVTTGAAVAMAGHFAKGNASAKETIDRISGSGVFARDPDSLVIFTKHEEEGAFVVETILRNFPPVAPFVVGWQWPVFRRKDELDPTKLKSAGGRPPAYTVDDLLECLGDGRLSSEEWEKLCIAQSGMSRSRFYKLLKELKGSKKLQKSLVDQKWELIQAKSRNYDPNNDQ
jgi:hypothetical protein